MHGVTDDGKNETDSRSTSELAATDLLQVSSDILQTWSDEDCLRAFTAGNECAFGILYARYKVGVHRYALRFFWNDPDRANDAFQETFIKLYEHARTFRHSSTVRTWLFTIAHNVCNNMIRDNGRCGRLEESHDDLPCDPTDHPDSHAHRTLVRERLATAFDALPSDLRNVLLLRELEGLSYANIAETTRTNVGIVRQRIWRAKQKLRSMLAQTWSDDTPRRKRG